MSTENEKEARSYAETFIAESKNKLLEDTKSKLSLDDLFSQIKAGNVKELPLIIKADVQGSVEAVKQSLVKPPSKICSPSRVMRQEQPLWNFPSITYAPAIVPTPDALKV